MAFEFAKETYSGGIKEITLGQGDKAVKVGKYLGLVAIVAANLLLEHLAQFVDDVVVRDLPVDGTELRIAEQAAQDPGRRRRAHPRGGSGRV